MITQAWTLLALERLACRLAVSEKKLLEAYRQITELCRGRVSVVELEYVLEAPICYLPGAELSTRPIRPSRDDGLNKITRMGKVGGPEMGQRDSQTVRWRDHIINFIRGNI